MHIAIAGNIGAGKTTLTKYLAKHYKSSSVVNVRSTPSISSVLLII